MPVNVTRISTLTNDSDGDGIADVGEALTIRVRITNVTATSLTNLNVFDTQNGLNVNPTSVKITPIAFDDTLPTISGNTPYTFSKAAILGNDVDPNDPSATFTVQLGSGTNGTIVDNGDGTLTFTPTTGFQGTASFTYSVVNTHEGETSVTPATVSLSVSGQIWYVDSGYAGGNGTADGSYLRPFANLTQLNGVTGDGTTNDDVDAAGDTIFVYDRGVTYTGGIVLEASEKLFGDSHALTVNGLSIGASNNNSTLTQSTGTVVTLSTDNTISGLGIAATGTAAGISGASFGTLNTDTTSIQTATGTVLSLTNGVAGSVGFTSLTSTGTVSTAAIAISNVDTGTVTVGTTNIGGTAAAGVSIIGDSSATFNFGSTTVTNPGGNAVYLNGDNGAVSFASLNSTGTITGINVINATHAVTVSGGATTGLLVTGGSGDVSVAASLTRTTSGSTVAVSGHTAGAITLSGAVSGTGAVNDGIALTNNTGGSITFSGGVTLTTGANTAVNVSGTAATGAAVSFTGGSLAVTTTTGNGIVATGTTLGAGSLTISGANNSISSGTGTALSVNTTTIGASGLTFRSISENGGTNGIVLNNTGTTGGLTVTGDAGSTNNGSGGTIQNTSGAGILLSNTRNVSFDQLNLTSTGGSGVQGTGVTNFSHTNSTFSSTGNATFESGIAFNDSANTLASGSTTASFGNNIAGTLVVTGNTFTNAFYSGLDVQADNGTVSFANVSNNTFTNPGFAGVNFAGTGNATTTFNLNDADINNNTLTGVGGTGIQVSIGNSNASGPGARAGFVTIDGNGRPIGDSAHIITIGGNTVTLDPTGAQAITVANSGGNSGSRTQTNFEIINNGTVANPLGSSSIGTVILVGNNGYADMAGHVDGNRITATQTPGGGGGSGIAGGNGVAGAGNAFNPRLTLSVQNNIISGTDGNGILLVGRGTSGTAYLHVAGNNVGAPVNAGGTAREGIRIDAGNASSADDAIYLNIHDNISAGSNTASGIGLRHQGTFPTTNDFGIYDAAGGPTLPSNPTNTDVTNFVNALNPGSATGGGFGTGGTDIISGSGFTRDATLAPTGAQPAMVAPETTTLDDGALRPHVTKIGESNWLNDDARVSDDVLPGAPALIDAEHQPAPPVDPVIPNVEPVSSTPPASGDLAAPAPETAGGALTQATLETVAAAAIARWAAAGATPGQVAAMQAVHLSITDMMGVQVGSAVAGAIEIDNDGAGYGWFVDQTPGDDSEFGGTGTALAAIANGGATGRMDLLTVLMHELGHQIGLSDGYNNAGGADLMYGYINAGERRLPGAGEAVSAVGHAAVVDAYVLSPVAAVGTLPASKAVDITYVGTVTAPAGAGLLASLTNTATASYDSGSSTSAAEVTPVDSLTLGDRVFLDVNKSGVFDAGDTGLAGVSLTLFADTNGNGSYDSGVDLAISYIDNNSNGVFDPATDTPAAAGTPGAIALTVVTNASGIYSFGNLAEGNYIVRVDASNFSAAGALVGRRAIGATSDPDNNLDNDSNATQFLPGQAGTYAASQTITLNYNSEPTAGVGNDTNNTLDLGFVVPNAAPTIANLQGDVVGITENFQASVDLGLNATISDSDSANFNGGSLRVQITTGLQASTDTILFVGNGTVSLSGQTAGATVFVKLGSDPSPVAIGTIANGNLGVNDTTINFNSDNATPARVQELIHALQFNANNDAIVSGARTIAFTLVDGDGTADGGADRNTYTTTVNITAVDDAPVAVADTAATLETAPTSGVNLLNNDTDVDGGPKMVTAVNGVTASVGSQITLASGALLTVNADGSYTYNPNGKFAYLVSPATAAATGAADGQATDTFTYTLNGGSTAGVTVTITGVDNAGSELRGDSGNNTVTGTAGSDLFNLSQGGNDTASGGASDDGFYFGAALNALDTVDGQAGSLDQVGLQGNYAGLVLGANTIKNVEQIVLLSGTDTSFGAPGGQSFSYNLTSDDGNVAAGQFLAVSANTLAAGESATINASAELDGSLVYYGGAGTDHITGGQQNDAFFFAQGFFGAGDTVDGQGGNLDQLALQGNFTLTFGAAQLVSIENLVLISASDVRFPGAADYTYNVTMNNANVLAGHVFSVTANTLTTGENLTFNAAAELDAGITVYSGAGDDTLTLGAGNDAVYGGAGNDTINGNAGADLIYGGLGADILNGGADNDTFFYLAVSDSTTASQDHILGFTLGDHIDLTALGSFQLVTGGFTAAGQVHVVSQGGGNYLVEAETNGNGVADLSILVTSDHALTAGDFVGVTQGSPDSFHRPDVPADVATDAPSWGNSFGLELFAYDAVPLLVQIGPGEVDPMAHDWHGTLAAALPDIPLPVDVP